MVAVVVFFVTFLKSSVFHGMLVLGHLPVLSEFHSSVLK